MLLFHIRAKQCGGRQLVTACHKLTTICRLLTHFPHIQLKRKSARAGFELSRERVSSHIPCPRMEQNKLLTSPGVHFSSWTFTLRTLSQFTQRFCPAPKKSKPCQTTICIRNHLRTTNAYNGWLIMLNQHSDLPPSQSGLCIFTSPSFSVPCIILPSGLTHQHSMLPLHWVFSNSPVLVQRGT